MAQMNFLKQQYFFKRSNICQN